MPSADEHAPLLIDAAGVARMLRVSRRHVMTLDSIGHLPACVKLGRCKRWSVSELTAWVSAGCPARGRWQFIYGARSRAKGALR